MIGVCVCVCVCVINFFLGIISASTDQNSSDAMWRFVMLPILYLPFSPYLLSTNFNGKL